MRPIISAPLAFLTIFILFNSCHKGGGGGAVTVLQILNPDKIPTQTFSLNAQFGGSITGTQGTILTFPPNAFINSNNQVVSGTVTIELKEIYSKADMVFGNMPTGTPSGPLRSEGEFYVNVRRNGENLRLQNGKRYSAFVPSSNPIQGMDVYEGEVDNNTGEVVWNTVDTTLNPSLAGYVASCDSLHWINIDAFSAGVQINLTYPLNTAYTGTVVYLWHHNLKSIVRAYSVNANTYWSPALNNEPVTVIGLAADANGSLWSSFTPATIAPNMTINFSFSSTTLQAFKNTVNSLP